MPRKIAGPKIDYIYLYIYISIYLSISLSLSFSLSSLSLCLFFLSVFSFSLSSLSLCLFFLSVFSFSLSFLSLCLFFLSVFLSLCLFFPLSLSLSFLSLCLFFLSVFLSVFPFLILLFCGCQETGQLECNVCPRNTFQADSSSAEDVSQHNSKVGPARHLDVSQGKDSLPIVSRQFSTRNYPHTIRNTPVTPAPAYKAKL